MVNACVKLLIACLLFLGQCGCIAAYYATQTSCIPTQVVKQEVRSIPVKISSDDWFITDKIITDEVMSLTNGIKSRKYYFINGHGLTISIHVPNKMTLTYTRKRCFYPFEQEREKKATLSENAIKYWWPPIDYTCNPERFSIDVFVTDVDDDIILHTSDIRLIIIKKEVMPIGVLGPIKATIESCCSCDDIYCLAKKSIGLSNNNIKLEENMCYSIKFSETHIGAETKFSLVLPFSFFDDTKNGGKTKHIVTIDFSDNY